MLFALDGRFLKKSGEKRRKVNGARKTGRKKQNIKRLEATLTIRRKRLINYIRVIYKVG